MANPKSEGNPFNDFSYEIRDPESGRLVTITDRDSLHDLLVGWPDKGDMLYHYALLTGSPLHWLDRDSQLMLARYDYAQTMHTPPYSGAYDDQPAYWIDAVAVIKDALKRAIEMKSRK